MFFKNKLPLILIALGAGLWGAIVIFVRGLAELGLSSMEIVTIRVAMAAILLAAIGLLRYRKELTIRVKDSWMFIGTGILSIVFFNWCYFTSLNNMDVSIAVILLYTAPIFVSILSYFIFKEKFTLMKMLALAGTFLGVIFVSGNSTGSHTDIGIVGLLIGIGAGFGYALYSIFGKIALRTYTTFTVTLYTFLAASVFLVPYTRIWEKASQLLKPEVLGYGLGLALFPTVLAYFLYTKGLEKTDSSLASIIATVEPIVATLLGVFMFAESTSIMQLIGSVVILLSVSVANMEGNPFRRIRKGFQSQ
ncbi:transporter [Bacillus sp. FJAT-27225]|uniref:DMT family transporter n=1 Tax=Bacillus sp. FJAT-27225 TaxID=1743144 RepID=UPI00080C2313|nr:EamA family transporter [Bacillus sp. FJAT-27225]OCA90875.1 transporter [Bacillus sp. FJAT-27225]